MQIAELFNRLQKCTIAKPLQLKFASTRYHGHNTRDIFNAYSRDKTINNVPQSIQSCRSITSFRLLPTDICTLGPNP